MSERGSLMRSDGAHGHGGDTRAAEAAAGVADVIYSVRLQPDMAFEYVSGSPQADLVGSSPDELFGDVTQWSVLEDQLTDAGLLTVVGRAAVGELVEFRVRWLADDGGPVWSQHRGRKVRRQDGSVVLHAVARDVTAEVDADRARDEVATRFRLLAENASDVVFQIGLDDAYEWVSPSARDVFGWDPESMVGRGAVDYVLPEDLARIVESRTHPAAGVAAVDEFRYRCANGEYLWVSGRSRELTGPDGRVTGRVVHLRDVNVQVSAREAERESEARYRLVVENTVDVVFRSNRAAELEWISPPVRELTGWDPEELIGRSIMELVTPEDRDDVVSMIDAVNRGERIAFEGRLDTVRGTRWVAVTAGPVTDERGVTVGGVGSVRDVHDRVEARVALARSEQQFRLAMASAPIGMAVVDLDRRFVEVNPALCQMLDRDSEWLRQHRVPDVLATSDDVLDLQRRAELLGGRDPSGAVEQRLTRADGSQVWVEHAIGLLRDEEGLPLSYVSQFVDVTDAKHAVDKLRYQATHDALTHLANRRDLFRRVSAMLARTPRGATAVAILFIDIDHLKAVNDHYGHAAGDELIVEIATRIQAVVHPSDVVARFGGDEFVVAVGAVKDLRAAEAIAAEILRSSRRPVDAQGHQVPATVSIGLALAEPGDDLDHVLQRADAALYRAKHEGRDRAVTYDPSADTDLDAESMRVRAPANQLVKSALAMAPGRLGGGSLVTADYLELLRHGDERAAIETARQHRAGGIAASELLEDLVAESQRQVGEAWLSTDWTVADEHVATSVSEQVRAAIVADTPVVDGHGDAPAPRVLVACAEGEGHTLPARLVADRLRLRGCQVVYLGAASRVRLQEMVQGWEPDVVALSCTLTVNLSGLARSVAAISDARGPIVVGGAALTGQPLAARLGADYWAASADDLVDFVLSRPTVRHPRAPVAHAARILTEPEVAARLTAVALDDLLTNARSLPTLDVAALAEIAEFVDRLVRTAGTAQFVNEPAAYLDHVDWAARYLSYRGEAPAVLAAALQRLAAHSDDSDPATAALFRDAATHVGGAD